MAYIKFTKNNLFFIVESTDDIDYILDITNKYNKHDYSVTSSNKEEFENQYISLSQQEKEILEDFIIEWSKLI